MPLLVKRLGPDDAGEFQRLRLEGFRLQNREFRFAPEDEAQLDLDNVKAKLIRDFVAGVFRDGELIAIAGLTCVTGVKLEHKALLWGMYVRAAHRGSGAADMLMRTLLDHAQNQVENVTLTVVSSNGTAVRLYERWGFQIYGVEPASVKLADGSYLDEALMIRRFI